MIIADHDIGGARVRRTFTKGDRQLKGGDRLTGDEVRSIPIANRRALIDSGYLEVWPVSAAENAPRHVISRGAGKYDVIAGVKLNEDYLTRDEAEALAAAAGSH